MVFRMTSSVVAKLLVLSFMVGMSQSRRSTNVDNSSLELFVNGTMNAQGPATKLCGLSGSLGLPSFAWRRKKQPDDMEYYRKQKRTHVVLALTETWDIKVNCKQQWALVGKSKYTYQVQLEYNKGTVTKWKALFNQVQPQRPVFQALSDPKHPTQRKEEFTVQLGLPQESHLEFLSDGITGRWETYRHNLPGNGKFQWQLRGSWTLEQPQQQEATPGKHAKSESQNVLYAIKDKAKLYLETVDGTHSMLVYRQEATGESKWSGDKWLTE